MSNTLDFTLAQRSRAVSEGFGLAESMPLCAHQLFEAQVKKTPDRLAAVSGLGRLDYRQLNACSNRLAKELRDRGVGANVLVGVCFQRSLEMLVALLAVWKAGGAYVPLDPSYPPERLAFMLEDSNALVLVTSPHLRRLFQGRDERALLLLDRVEPDRGDEPNLDLTWSPSDLAYVMYTSGSTGRPKGAMIPHIGLSNYLLWARSAYDVQEGSSALVHTSISFDLTVTSLYTPLIAGAYVELAPDGITPQGMLDVLLARENRSVLKITPAHLELLGHLVSPDQAPRLARTFVIGGENLRAETLQMWRKHAPHTRLINEYGPTETVVGCCVYEVRPGDPDTGSVPIGAPIRNCQMYLLDPDKKPVALGSVGEIYIGGIGVGRGYWKNAALTAERFISDPFSKSGGCLYRSGDLGRMRPDGVLEYLGRIDDQVKISGYRIELGEIETALSTYKDIQSCVVVVREDVPGDKRLVAYYTSRRSEEIPSAKIRGHLAEILPEYMVPADYVFMNELPLTPNGKIHKQVLPPPPKHGAGSRDGRFPSSPTEKMMAAIWSEVLRVTEIRTSDDFFLLGGHSLTGTALLARIRAKFGVPVKLSSLFEFPTVEGLSQVVDALMLAKNRPEATSEESEEFEI